MAKTATTGFTEAFVHTDPFYRGTYKATLRRGASGSGVSDAVVTRTNLLTNPNFETNTTGWNNATCTISRVTTDAFIGTACLQMVATGTSTAAQIGQNPDIVILPNTTYVVSAYVRNTVGATRNHRVQIRWALSGGGTLVAGGSVQVSVANADGWVRLSTSATSPSDAVGMDLLVQMQTTGGAIGNTTLVDACMIETGSTLLPYFDGTYADTYTGYTLTEQAWNGTANASTSTATFRPTVAHKVTQVRLSGLTDFSFPYRFGGRFYLGFAKVQTTATGSGAGTQSASRLIKRFHTATGSGLGTQTAARLIKRFRTATGSGTGTQTAARLISRYRTATGTGQGTETTDRLVSRYRTATGSGLGTETVIYSLVPTVKREATGSGLGTETVIGVVIKYATATGSGVGASNNTILLGLLRTAYGSGGATAGDNATGLLTAYRTASSSGIGTSSVSQRRGVLRLATGSGTGTSTTVYFETFPRAATGSGLGSSAIQQLQSHLRSSTSLGEGSSAVIGARVVRVGSTGEGTGSYVPSVWVKSHIFRVPYTYNYPGATYRDEGAANRLQRYNRTNVRVRNLYELTDGSYTTVDQRDQGQVAKLWLGGHDHYLTDAEVVELTAAGFGASIT